MIGGMPVGLAQAELQRTAVLRAQCNAIKPSILSCAINAFGPILDPSWEFQGVFFVAGASHVGTTVGKRHVGILLGYHVETDPDRRLHELAHEVVHLLSVQPGRAIPMLEEGAATHFSLTAPTFSTPGYAAELRAELDANPLAAHYSEALRAYEVLAAIEPFAVRKARAIEPNFSRITPGLLQSVAPGLPARTAAVLCESRDMLEMWRAAQPVGRGVPVSAID